MEPGVIPFTPLARPLRECTVALVSTAGVARNDDRPFDQEGERRNPWWGDPSFRAIPLGTTEKDVRLYHMHIDPRFGESDLDVVLPMRRLAELDRLNIPAMIVNTLESLLHDPQLEAAGNETNLEFFSDNRLQWRLLDALPK